MINKYVSQMIGRLLRSNRMINVFFILFYSFIRILLTSDIFFYLRKHSARVISLNKKDTHILFEINYYYSSIIVFYNKKSQVIFIAYIINEIIVVFIVFYFLSLIFALPFNRNKKILKV